MDLKRISLFNKHRRTSRLDDPNSLLAKEKGEAFVEYRRRYDGARRADVDLTFPVDLAIEIIDSCNYACPYCTRAIKPGDKTVMSNDTYRRLIDEFVEGTQGMGGIGFDRGEPMLDKGLEEKIKYATEHGVLDVILTTNAVFLTPDRSRRLIEAGLTKLHVSLDAATQETYEKTRGGCLEIVEKNIRDFLRIRSELGRQTPVLRVSFVVCELNEHEFNQFEDKWAPVVDYVDFQRCLDLSRLDTLPDFEVEPFECDYPFRSIAVSAKGEIKPCCSLYADKLVYGSLSHGDTIASVFNSDKTEKLRESFRNGRDYDVVCKNCRGRPKDTNAIQFSPLLTASARKTKRNTEKS